MGNEATLPSHRTRRGYFYGSIDVRTHAIGRVYCFCRPVPDVRRICIFCTVPTVRPIVSNRLPNCSTSSISSHFCMTMKIRTVSTSMFKRGSKRIEEFFFFFSKNTIISYYHFQRSSSLSTPRILIKDNRSNYVETSFRKTWIGKFTKYL